MTLILNHLNAGYGNKPVLKDVNLSIESGEMVGLIGLNGAGKSTTIKNIIGLLQPYSGEISLDNLTLAKNPGDYRKKIGYIPESPILYEELTLKEHLEITAMAYDLSWDKAWALAEGLLKIFRLDTRLDWLPVHFSKGMKQKVMVVTALMINPSLLIIDEPFLGLDPLAIHDLLELLTTAKKNGAAILMSTHILATAEIYCDRFLVMHQGTIIADGSLKDLQEQFNQPGKSLDEIYLTLTQIEQVQ
ncbi:ABC transporter ATP-binding protein [Enterococcus timonensis]|uniref:ABC transporter ATP-binding protein n=1 Tax=Enterococcus timonensis TaxID=1852364 RepID=UPI0008D9A6A2|nr:ABC transporter ATP-binding protein [Enterococcus timonensis]